MTPYTLALAASVWSHPASLPCATEAGNPCLSGPIPTQVGEICDGDLVRMWGARDGEMVGPWLMSVALDVSHLRAKGFRFRTREDGATCIPTLTDGDRHLVEACGNPAEVLSQNSPIAAAIFQATGYMRGGSSSAGPRTWGGASAHVASPPIPPVYVATWPSPAPYEPVAQPELPGPGVDPLPAPPTVPLPASVWMLMAAVAMLGASAVGRRA